MLTDTQQHDRRSAIVRILRAGFVRKQEDLVRLLKKEGHEVTQSSVSRDLRDMGVLKASGRYVLPPNDLSRANGDFGSLAQFVVISRAPATSARACGSSRKKSTRNSTACIRKRTIWYCGRANC